MWGGQLAAAGMWWRVDGGCWDWRQLAGAADSSWHWGHDVNYLNILFIIVPQGTLARVLVPRASMGVEITPLSENDINNLCVNIFFV